MMSLMNEDVTLSSPTASAAEKPGESHKKTIWNVRDALGSLEAMRRYDVYITEHRRRLRQLYKEARGDMSPSGEW